MEKDVVIEKDRNEAMVKKDLAVLQTNERRDLESARERERLCVTKKEGRQRRD